MAKSLLKEALGEIETETLDERARELIARLSDGDPLDMATAEALLIVLELSSRNVAEAERLRLQRLQRRVRVLSGRLRSGVAGDVDTAEALGLLLELQIRTDAALFALLTEPDPAALEAWRRSVASGDAD